MGPTRQRSVAIAAVLVLLLASCASDGATAPAPAPAGSSIVRSTHVYGTSSDGHDLVLDVVRTRGGSTKRPVMVLVHGGGFQKGSRTEYRREAGYLARRGWVVVPVDYELRGGDIDHDRAAAVAALHVAVGDVSDAIAWLRRHVQDFDGDPDQIVAFGESAGGTTATALAYEGSPASQVVAAVSASGRTDPYFYPEFDRGDAPMLFVSWRSDPADDVELSRRNCAAARRVGIRCENEVLEGDQHGLDLVAHHDIVERFFAAAGVAPGER